MIENSYASSSTENPYQYNGKEIFKDFGFNSYNYGARWYDPAVGRFSGVDPLADHPNQIDKNPYAYAWNNPVLLTDPDGQFPDCAWDAVNVGIGVASFISNVKQGNVGAAVVDAVGVVVDAAATVVPLVPGGAGTLIKTSRGAENAIDAFKVVDDYADDVVRQASQKGTDAHKAAKLDIAKESGEGVIYKVDGSNTPSGKPYIGSADDLSKRAKTAKDGRDRSSNTEIIGGYEKGNKTSRKISEQKGIIDNGGVKNLDNKRNEIKPSDWKKYGIDN